MKKMINQDLIEIIIKENGEMVKYDYSCFKEGFEEWAENLELDLVDEENLENYLKERGHKVINVHHDLSSFKEMEVLYQAIELLGKHVNSSSATDKANESLNKLVDHVIECGEVDKELISNVKEDIIKSSKYAGYTNIQHNLLEDIKNILNEE